MAPVWVLFTTYTIYLAKKKRPLGRFFVLTERGIRT